MQCFPKAVKVLLDNSGRYSTSSHAPYLLMSDVSCFPGEFAVLLKMHLGDDSRQPCWRADVET